MYLKDTQLPCRSDGIDVLAAHMPVTSAPGLRDLLSDKRVMDRLQVTFDEVDFMVRMIKGETGWPLRTMDAGFWLDILGKLRTSKLDILNSVRRNHSDKTG